MKWTKIFSEIGEDNVIRYRREFMPEKSGVYLCSCIITLDKNLINHKTYLKEMSYDAEKNFWHDKNRPGSISDIPYAWSEEIVPCDLDNMEYFTGGFFMERPPVSELTKYLIE